MRIGLFSDTYHPTINGITFVVESLKNNLEAMGHEVFVFCPARTMMPGRKKYDTPKDSDHIIRFPSFKSGFFDDFDFTVFFPPTMLRRIKDLDLDVIHVFTPSQVGLLGINAAVKYDIPLITQHSTDLYEFVEHYPLVLPGVLALIGVVFPMSVKLDGHDIKEIIKLHRPRLGATKWNQHMISKAVTMIYSKADATIALSRKSYDQLSNWQGEDYKYSIVLMPNGVGAIKKPSKAKLDKFRKQWNLSESDEVFGFVGRLGEEKNLALLVEAMEYVGKVRPRAKLLFVGDFDYRETLEEMAGRSEFADRIVFTGAMPRTELGVAYAAMNVFCFPSLKDTQGWVLHEAAHASLPIVLIDTKVSEVVQDGRNGYFAKNNSEDFANKVTALLKSPTKRKAFGEHSKKLASAYTERRQVKKLEALYKQIIADSKHDAHHGLGRDA